MVKNEESPLSPEGVRQNLVPKFSFGKDGSLSAVLDFRFSRFLCFRSSKRRSVRGSVRLPGSFERELNLATLPWRKANDVVFVLLRIWNGAFDFSDVRTNKVLPERLQRDAIVLGCWTRQMFPVKKGNFLRKNVAAEKQPVGAFAKERRMGTI